jgi:hypothetical protein
VGSTPNLTRGYRSNGGSNTTRTTDEGLTPGDTGTPCNPFDGGFELMGMQLPPVYLDGRILAKAQLPLLEKTIIEKLMKDGLTEREAKAKFNEMYLPDEEKERKNP